MYRVQKQAKLLCGARSQGSDYPRGKMWVIGKGHTKASRMLVVFSALSWVLVTQVHSVHQA